MGRPLDPNKPDTSILRIAVTPGERLAVQAEVARLRGRGEHPVSLCSVVRGLIRRHLMGPDEVTP